MQFDEFSSQVRAILALEFSSRDRDIQSSVTGVKQQMNARGVLHSTIAIQSLADFFVAEFRARINLIAEHAISALRSDGATIQISSEAQAGLALFRLLATEQLEVTRRAYDGSTEAILTSLQSKMPDQIRTEMVERMDDLMKKLDLAVELEYKLSVSPTKELLTLRPTIYGVGIDLKELWKKYFG